MKQLKNISRQLHTFTLLHDVACKETCGCFEFPVRGMVHTNKVPASLTLAVRETVDIPDELAELPDVKAAIRRGDVALIDAPAPAVVVAQKSGPGDDPEEKTRRARK
jgi:hypothetical protein